MYEHAAAIGKPLMLRLRRFRAATSSVRVSLFGESAYNSGHEPTRDHPLRAMILRPERFEIPIHPAADRAAILYYNIIRSRATYANTNVTTSENPFGSTQPREISSPVRVIIMIIYHLLFSGVGDGGEVLLYVNLRTMMYGELSNIFCSTLQSF